MALTRMMLLKYFSDTLCKYKSAYICRIWVTLFFNPLSSLSLHISLLLLLLLDETVFCVTKFICGVKSASLFIKTPCVPAHTRLSSTSVILSSFTLSPLFHTHLPSINTPPVQPTFPFSLWHKTDWGWLVLSWLLRFSTGNTAAGAGGGAGSSSRARPTQGQEAGSSVSAKPAGGWTAQRQHAFRQDKTNS